MATCNGPPRPIDKSRPSQQSLCGHSVAITVCNGVELFFKVVLHRKFEHPDNSDIGLLGFQSLQVCSIFLGLPLFQGIS